MSHKSKPPLWFWGIGLAFLGWNLIGCYFYYIDRTLDDAAYAASYGEAMLAIRDQYPVWAVSAYAIAVWSGLVAALLFLFRKKAAAPIFTLSLIAAILSFVWPITTSEARAASGDGFWIMPVVVIVLGIAEVWVTRHQVRKGILFS